jgi:hypothetical protein
VMSSSAMEAAAGVNTFLTCSIPGFDSQL